jgi:hypothetical protein
MYSEVMLEILVLVEIIETRLHAKQVIFDKTASFSEIDFFIVLERTEVIGNKKESFNWISKRSDFKT